MTTTDVPTPARATAVAITAELGRRIKRRAIDEDTTMQALVAKVMTNYLDAAEAQDTSAIIELRERRLRIAERLGKTPAELGMEIPELPSTSSQEDATS